METNNKVTSKLNIFILVTLSFVVLYFSLKDDFNAIIDNILKINIFWFALGIFFMSGYWFFRSLAFYKLVLKFDDKYSFKRSFGIIMLTQFFNAVTPFATGGQPLVIYTLKKDGIRGTDSTNIVVQDFITYQIALIGLSIIAILANHFFNIFTKVGLLREIVISGFIINAAVVIGLFLVAFARRFNHWVVNLTIKILTKFKRTKNKDQLIAKWDERVNSFHDGAARLIKDKKRFVYNIFLNFMGLVSLYLVPVAILYSMGDYHSFSPVIAIIASAYIMLVSAFIPSPGSTGGIEFAFIAFFSNFLKGSILNAMMLIWRVITYYLGLVIGALIFNTWRKRD